MTPHSWPQYLAKFMLNDLRGEMRRRKLSYADIQPASTTLARLAALAHAGVISRQVLKAAVRMRLDDLR